MEDIPRLWMRAWNPKEKNHGPIQSLAPFFVIFDFIQSSGAAGVCDVQGNSFLLFFLSDFKIQQFRL